MDTSTSGEVRGRPMFHGAIPGSSDHSSAPLLTSHGKFGFAKRLEQAELEIEQWKQRVLVLEAWQSYVQDWLVDNFDFTPEVRQKLGRSESWGTAHDNDDYIHGHGLNGDSSMETQPRGQYSRMSLDLEGTDNGTHQERNNGPGGRDSLDSYVTAPVGGGGDHEEQEDDNDDAVSSVTAPFPLRPIITSCSSLAPSYTVQNQDQTGGGNTRIEDDRNRNPSTNSETNRPDIRIAKNIIQLEESDTDPPSAPEPKTIEIHYEGGQSFSNSSSVTGNGAFIVVGSSRIHGQSPRDPRNKLSSKDKGGPLKVNGKPLTPKIKINTPSTQSTSGDLRRPKRDDSNKAKSDKNRKRASTENEESRNKSSKHKSGSGSDKHRSKRPRTEKDKEAALNGHDPNQARDHSQQPQSSTSNSKHAQSSLDESERDAPCEVCGEVEPEVDNEMVFCDSCNICVHRACYGIPQLPSGSWKCKSCSKGVENPTCVFCPGLGGAFTPVRSPAQNKWAHVVCAKWIPEVCFGAPQEMAPVINVPKIPKGRFSLKCQFCHVKGGACIQCRYKRCVKSYHVTCAMKAGLAMVEDDQPNHVDLISYCERHRFAVGGTLAQMKANKPSPKSKSPGKSQVDPDKLKIRLK